MVLRLRGLFSLAILMPYVHGASPNVVLVMRDDLGYGDLRCFNPRSPINTPHIDALASSGLKFTRFYSAGPVCSPTRGSCLTGRHPYRYGIYSANTGHIKLDEITLPEFRARTKSPGTMAARNCTAVTVARRGSRMI